MEASFSDTLILRRWMTLRSILHGTLWSAATISLLSLAFTAFASSGANLAQHYGTSGVAMLPDMLRASWRLQASLLKLNIEAARLGPGVSGYHQWLFRDYWTQSSGIESILGTTRALSPEISRQFNADAVLLWDHDRVNFRWLRSR